MGKHTHSHSGWTSNLVPSRLASSRSLAGRLPGPVYPGQGGVLGPTDPINHPEREGASQGGRHPHPPRVRERGQETQIENAHCVITFKIVLLCRPFIIVKRKYSLPMS